MTKIDSNYKKVTVGGAPEGFEGKLIADWAERQGGPVLHIAKNDRRLADIAGAIAFFSPSLPVLSFPAWDCMPFDRISPRAEITSSRLSLLAALARGSISGPIAILATINSSTQFLPPRESICRFSFSASVGRRINLSDFLERLAGSGYQRRSKVMEPGEFAVRGGIIDLFPLGRNDPARLDFFGDVLDGIRVFDPETQLTTGKLEELDIAPGAEFFLDNESVSRFRGRYRAELGSPPPGAALYESVSNGQRTQGMEHWLPLFYERLETIFDYLPDAQVSFDERDELLRQGRWDLVLSRYESRLEATKNSPRSDIFAPPCKPDLLYLNPERFEDLLANRKSYQLRSGRIPPGPAIIDCGGRPGFEFSTISGTSLAETQLEKFTKKIHELKKDSNVVIACWSEGSKARLAALLGDAGAGDIQKIDGARDLERLQGKTCIAVWALESGFYAPGNQRDF